MTAILIVALAFNLALGISYVIIPLYAYHLGFSGVAIGSLISLPIIAQIGVRFVGGPLTARYGEKKLLLGALTMIAVAGFLFRYADSYLLLLVGQFSIVVARGLFWPVIQSLVSLAAGKINVMMGRLNATNNIGQISGSAGAGFLVSFFGFQLSFLVLTLMGAVALLATAWIPSAKRVVATSSFKAFADMWGFFRSRSMYFAILCSFIGAQPYSLGQSFYPVLLSELGFSPEAVGQILSVRPIGGIFAGLFLARLIRPFSSFWLPFLCATGAALSIGLTPFFEHLFLLGFVILGLGIGSEIMAINYQVIGTEVSDNKNRASALVVAGLGWSIAHLITPIIFGLLADTLGLVYAFYYWGGLLFVLGLSILPVHYYAFRKRADVSVGFSLRK